MREDGALLPVARLAEGRWSTPWPEAQRELDSPVPIGLNVPAAWLGGDLSLPKDWRLQSAGKKPIYLRPSAIEKVESHCSELWGVRVAPGKAAAEGPWPIGKVGAASAGGLAVSIFDSADSSETARARSVLEAEFPAWQREREKESESDREKSRGKGRPRELKVELECAPSASLGGRLCHFHARRRFGRRVEDVSASCDISFSADGWLLDKGGRARVLSREAGFGDCDMPGTDFTAPFGIFTAGGSEYVFVEVNGYESESYLVERVRDGLFEEAVRVYAGGC